MFCILEKDHKTYSYLQKFIEYIKENKMDYIHQLDNYIQKDEISEHLKINGFSENDRAEIMNWIYKYSSEFRQYLNTIKIAALLWVINFGEKELTWENFCKLEDELNQKKVCLDTLHI